MTFFYITLFMAFIYKICCWLRIYSSAHCTSGQTTESVKFLQTPVEPDTITVFAACGIHTAGGTLKMAFANPIPQGKRILYILQN